MNDQTTPDTIPGAAPVANPATNATPRKPRKPRTPKAKKVRATRKPSHLEYQIGFGPNAVDSTYTYDGGTGMQAQTAKAARRELAAVIASGSSDAARLSKPGDKIRIVKVIDEFEIKTETVTKVRIA